MLIKNNLIYIIVIASIFCLWGCDGEMKSLNAADRPEKLLEELILKKGDKDAYIELYIAYMDYGIEKFYPYSFVMANTYNDRDAYYNMFFELMVVCRRDTITITDSSAAELMKYFNKAYTLNSVNAKRDYEEAGLSENDSDREKVMKLYNTFFKPYKPGD